MGGSDEEKYDHPTQKPVDLMRRPILNHTKRGELVYEPFLGSGTTLAAAELTERVCCGMELDPKYVDCDRQRWQTLSGKQATLEGDGRTFEEIARGTAEGGSMNRSLPPGDRGRGIQLRAGHPDVEGLCLALVDWSAELRLLQASQGLATVAPRLAHVGSSRAEWE